ncbi:hypothetical protein [Labrenzia sp. VG12]|uniref:hypothetical protein n=1 Tax=Labrenzia sp. VG12 TaxID=2021862 RepID=UPI001FFD2708|nr:hypothetical protein [Labrenzia sp. VG12]
MSSEFLQTLSDHQDRDADLKLLQEAIGHESITGNETDFASFLKSRMDELGLQTGSGDFLPGRLNVWGKQKQPVRTQNGSCLSATPTQSTSVAGKTIGRANRRRTRFRVR